MKPSIFLFALIAATLTFSAGASDAAAADQQSHSLTIKVIEHGTAATGPVFVPNVMVTIYKSDGTAQAANTGPDGVLVWPDVPTGRMKIRLTKPGYQTKEQIYMMPAYHATVFVEFQTGGSAGGGLSASSAGNAQRGGGKKGRRLRIRIRRR